ncbi:MAG: hypothetical protein AABY01_02075 [Nanoarchaeota archaeon]
MKTGEFVTKQTDRLVQQDFLRWGAAVKDVVREKTKTMRDDE